MWFITPTSIKLEVKHNIFHRQHIKWLINSFTNLLGQERKKIPSENCVLSNSASVFLWCDGFFSPCDEKLLKLAGMFRHHQGHIWTQNFLLFGYVGRPKMGQKKFTPNLSRSGLNLLAKYEECNKQIETCWSWIWCAAQFLQWNQGLG